MIFFLCFSLFGKEKDSIREKTEKSIKIQQSKETSYLKILEDIAKKEDVTYLEYYDFLSTIHNKLFLKYEPISRFINNRIKEPINKKVINLNYVKIKWLQVYMLREYVSIEAATKVQNELDNYIRYFKEQDVNVRKAKLYSDMHQIVLYIIEQDIENGKKLCLDNLNEAKRLNDKELEISFLTFLVDFLIQEKKIDECIKVSEESFAIEKTLQKKSIHYFEIIFDLIDAYLYKGVKYKKIQELLKILKSHRDTKPLTYVLYIQFIGNFDLNDLPVKNIFKEFEVSNLKELCKKTDSLGSQSLNSRYLYNLFKVSARTLEKHNYLKEAIRYQSKCVLLTKRIYTEDLANSLADVKSQKAIDKKNIELKYVQERNNLYLIFSLSSLVLLVLSGYAFLRKRKLSRVLELKNIKINKVLKEKELLVKEVHHRVKNNFQMVSSLLELQIKDVEDEKALVLINEGKHRVKSMALIHQNLYQTESGLIDFDAYIKLLIKEIASLYTTNNVVETKVCAENMHFDVDTAIPLGLIINELATNAYKYAFIGKKTGKLNITLNSIDKNNFKLSVFDNGSGLDTTIDIKNIKSFGLRLVSRLAKQLQGTLTISNHAIASFEVIFKDRQGRKLID